MGVVMTAFSAASNFRRALRAISCEHFQLARAISICRWSRCADLDHEIRENCPRRTQPPSKVADEARRAPSRYSRPYLLARIEMIGTDPYTGAHLLSHFSIIPFLSPYMGITRTVRLHIDGQLTFIYFLGGMATLFSSPWGGRETSTITSGHSRIFADTLLGMRASHHRDHHPASDDADRDRLNFHDLLSSS